MKKIGSVVAWSRPIQYTSRNHSIFILLRRVSLAALDLAAGVEQPFNCLTIQPSGRSVVGRSMDWTFVDNMVDRVGQKKKILKKGGS